MVKKENRRKLNSAIIFLIVGLLLVGCSKEVREVPELIEPLADNQSFRPVERGSIGRLRIEVGMVVPNMYSHFYRQPTKIKEIYYDIGDYVEAGAVLATADTESLEDDIVEWQSELDYLAKEHEAKQPLYELHQHMNDINWQISNSMEDGDGVADSILDRRKEEEQKRYDDKLYESLSNMYQKKIAKAYELIEDSTLRAKKSGFVTYVKNVGESTYAAMDEAIVVIGDYEDTHIEIPGAMIVGNPYRVYQRKYALISGKQVPIEEWKYSDKEAMMAKAKTQYPAVRFLPEGQTMEDLNLKVGDRITLFFASNNKQDVLYVGFDSTYTDEGGNYVYVDNGQEELEKRYVELGTSDDFYIEVKSGLEEKERVFYTQESLKPTKKNLYTVEPSEYVQTKELEHIRQAETLFTPYFAPEGGQIDKIMVSNGDLVNTGDSLMTIHTDHGEAELLDVDLQIKHLTMEHQKAIEDAKKIMDEKRTQNLMMLTTIEMGVDAGSMSEQEQDAIQYNRNMLDEEIRVMEVENTLRTLEYEHQLEKLQRKKDKIIEKGTAQEYIEVTAKGDSKVIKVPFKEKEVVKAGDSPDLLMTCVAQKKQNLMMGFGGTGSENAAPRFGAKITITDKQEKKLATAEVIGFPQSKTCLAFTENEEVYVTPCLEMGGDDGYIIARVDNPDFAENIGYEDCKGTMEQMHLKDALIIPGEFIFSEDSNKEDKKKYFVWKIVGDDLVKHYIIKGTDYGIGNDAECVILYGVEPGDVLAK